MSNQSAVPVAPSLANASSMMVASAFGTLGGWMQYLCDTVCSHVSWVGKETWHWIIAVLLVIVLLFKLHHYMFEHKQLAKMTLYRQAMTNFRICSHHIAVLFDSVSNGFNSTLQFMYKFGVASCGYVFAVVMCLMSGPTKSEIDDAKTKLPFEVAADAQIEHEHTVRGGACEIRQKEYEQLAKHMEKLSRSPVFTNTAGNSGANGGKGGKCKRRIDDEFVAAEPVPCGSKARRQAVAEEVSSESEEEQVSLREVVQCMTKLSHDVKFLKDALGQRVVTETKPEEETAATTRKNKARTGSGENSSH